MIAKRHKNMKSTAMGSCDQLGRNFKDLIDLSLGDPDLTTPKEIIEKAFKDALSGHTHYTEFLGDIELRKEISKREKVNLSDIIVTTSACYGMWLVLESILDPKDEVIIISPYFTPYPDQVKLAGGIPVIHKTFEKENFYINIERLKNQINEKTKAIIINTPNNPTGVCLPFDLMKDLANLAKKEDIIIISDDIYTSFHYKSEFIPMRSLYEKTITIKSFSKDYCMTGWRIGYVIGPETLINTMSKINENSVFTAPSISQRAALYALKNKEKIQNKLVSIYKERLFYAYERVKENRYLSTLKPEGSIYMFINIEKTGLDSEEFSKYLLKKAHVLVLPGIAFGDYENYVRLAVTVEIDKIKEAFNRIDKLDFKEAKCLK